MVLISRRLALTCVAIWIATLFLLPTVAEANPTAQTANPSDGKAEASLETNSDTLRLTIGNRAIGRTVELGPKGARTTTINNRFTNTNYLATSNTEFRIGLSHELAHDEQTAQLTSDDFKLIGYNWIKQSDAEQQISFSFQGSFQGAPVNLALYYQAQAGKSFIRKWFNIAPFQAHLWTIEWATLEDWDAKPEVQPLGLFQRYSQFYSNGQTKYAESDKDKSIITTNPSQRFAPTELSRQAMLHTNNKEGLFFFQESLFGEEQFKSDGSLGLGNSDFIDLTQAQGFSSGRSVLGAWQGPAEIGLNRYNDYLYNDYAIVKDKRDPVWFSTWYIYENQINESNMLEMLGRMQSAGYYDLLHLDAGWEEGAPLQLATSPQKFPNGLRPLLNKMSANNYTLGIWMNPFSGRYQDYVSYKPFYEKNPQWTRKADPLTLICPLSGAGSYVRDQLLKLARETPLEEIYWDGLDWQMMNCRSEERNWRTLSEERVLMIKYYDQLLKDLRAIRPNLRVVLWSPPSDIHWLATVDQLQLSDMYELPLGESELARRQQLYFASFTRPNSTIWGDWYGLGYRRSRDEGLGAPLNQLKYAEMTQLGNGATQAGGSFDLANAPADLVKFLAKMFNFRKAFAPYFNVYQHILDFPDGQSVEGEAHLLNGEGFLLLYNPTATPLTVKLPMDEPGLELDPTRSYSLSDWSNLDSGQGMSAARPKDAPTIIVPATSWKIIGINMPLALPKR